MSFVHLHVHTHYTLLESTNRVKDVVKRAKDLGMPAVAVTDRGNLCAAFELQAACTTAGLKPIIGCQVNIAPLGMTEKTRDTHQLVLLAMNQTGYRNLCALVSAGWLTGFYFEPRVDLELLAKHHEGLICLTGAGRDGFLNRHLHVGADDEAERQLGLLTSIFPDRVYIELCDHGTDGPVSLIAANRRIAERTGVPVVATNWIHYLDRDAAVTHDVQLAVQGVTTVADTRRKRMDGSEYGFKTAEEMTALFADCPQAIANTLAIAERIDAKVIETGVYHLPVFTCPDGHDEMSYLRELCAVGVRRRYGDEYARTDITERLAFELETIQKMGFAAYFLIVADFINWAKDRGIPVGPGRGSAAGSIVAYALGITDMCPLRYGLLFERFLNPGRKSMPDIDIDFCKDRRGEVIEYVADKYGHDAVTHIMTLGTMKARMAIKDVARAFEWTPEEAQELANLITEDPSGKHTIEVCLGLKPLDKDKNLFDPVPALRSRYDSDPRTRTVLDTAIALEGLGRNFGVHACGIIIAPGAVSQYVPVCAVKGKPATQFNMGQVESCGLLKMDFLGLKTMSILKKTADVIRATGGGEIDFTTVPLDDPRTFELLGTGRTLGVFQCESSGFQELIKLLKPDRFEDLIALVALYRPGPLMANMHISYCDRKHGRERVDYPHPVLEEALKETYGLYIYQEQVMTISRALCGFTPAEADDLRKAMGKKDINVLKKLEEKFVEGAWNLHQFDRNKCKEMWEKILGFASYCFNKSHSACYGLIAYWTAWAKANHYAAFMTANLIYEMDNKDKMTLFVEELRGQGIPVLPPDVNRSGWEFTVVQADAKDTAADAANTKVLFGFGGVKGIGEQAAQHLIQERTSAGDFTSLYDLCERIDTRAVNKRVIENLIKVGAMDALHPNRRALMEAVDRAFDRGHRLAKVREQNQQTLFGSFDQDDSFRQDTQGYADVSDFPAEERLAAEKALTGYWISSHPVREHQEDIAQVTSADFRDLTNLPTGSMTSIAAVVIGKRIIKTKTGRMMGILTLEDPYGRFEGVLFPGGRVVRGQAEPGPFEKYAAECDEDLVAVFTGKIERRERQRRPPPRMVQEGDEEPPIDAGEDAPPAEAEAAVEILPSLLIQEVIPATAISVFTTRAVVIAVEATSAVDAQRIDATEALFREHAGKCPVRLLVHAPGDVLLSLALSDRWVVHPTRALLTELRRLWGADRIHVQPKNQIAAEIAVA